MIVDEAYIDFAGRSAIELIDKYDNLIVTQTFSKARSMAGMRIGYAISNPDLIRCLNDVKYSFNSYTMNQTALACGVEAVKDKVYFEEGVRKIVDELFQALKENNIYVRHWNAPRIDQYLRITIGTREEMETLFDFLRTYIKEK